MKRILPALLALSLAANVQAEEYKDGVIYCKATIASSDTEVLSVYLPPTPGCVDHQGSPTTVWNVGNVPSGGVADTFFSDKGPGAFQVKNDGNRAAFVYVITGCPTSGFYAYDTRPGAPAGISNANAVSEEGLIFLFGEMINHMMPQPVDEYRNGVPFRSGYRLAVSTDVTGKVPNWRPLNWMYVKPTDAWEFREFQTGQDFWNWSTTEKCYQFLSYLAPGETQLFDLKFWAPSDHPSESIGFVVVLQASQFRLWQHDM